MSVDNVENVTTVPVVGEVPIVSGTQVDLVKSRVEKKVRDETTQKWSSERSTLPIAPALSDVVDRTESKTYQKKSWKGSKRTSDVQGEKRVSIYDLTKTWIDSENDRKLWLAKKLLFKFATGELRNREFMFCAPIHKFVEYLSDKSQGYFTLVADHPDYESGKIARLYDWRVRDNEEGTFHVYIVAIGDVPSETHDWASKRMEVYQSVVDKNWDDEQGAITPKGYSIVRRFATTDFCTSFMNLKFFTDFNLARTFITSSVSGFVRFMSKSQKTREQGEWEGDTSQWEGER